MEETTPKQNPYIIAGAIIVAGIIIAGAVFLAQNPESFGLSKEKGAAQEVLTKEEENPKMELTITERDHIRGNPDALVTIVEYSDFQCPFCRAFHPTLQQILADYPDEVRWVYKHFPLDQIHPEARPAAEASECVAEQKGNEGFWQFADLLFENQDRLGADLYRELAGNLGLDIDQFDGCFVSRKYQERVEGDLKEGIALGVRGTPGSFVNGEPVLGAQSYSVLQQVIEFQLSP